MRMQKTEGLRTRRKNVPCRGNVIAHVRSLRIPGMLGHE